MSINWLKWVTSRNVEILKIKKLQCGTTFARNKPIMKKKVLIAEDDPALIKLYKMVLEETFELDIACNGQEALDSANVHRPDIIVMDLMMPVMDGLEALSRFKENPATATIPVILTNGQNPT